MIVSYLSKVETPGWEVQEDNYYRTVPPILEPHKRRRAAIWVKGGIFVIACVSSRGAPGGLLWCLLNTNQLVFSQTQSIVKEPQTAA